MRKNKTIWVDISELKNWTGSFSGIQRTIYSIVKELIEDDELNIKLCRFDYRRKNFVETEYDFIEHVSADPVQTTHSASRESFIASMKKVVPGPIKRRLKKVVSYTTPPYVSVRPRVDFKDGDKLFLSGAFWTGQLSGVEELKRAADVEVVAVMYDMVPAIMPELCARVTDIDFNREIKRAIRMVDDWVCISENTKRDLVRYADSQNTKLDDAHLKVIRLGSDINIDGPIRSPFSKKDTPTDFILFVGTIEARKNHILVYQAVKLAREQGVSLPKIVFVGKHGWHADDLVSYLERDETINDSIVWLKNADDAMLRWLYKNCLFTIYPSLYEGWGLPVAESVSYGKFSIASKSSSIPEIAGDLIDYVSPYSAQELLDKMSHYYLDRKDLDHRSSALKTVPESTWATAATRVKESLVS